jgi:hypothetical protein
MATFYVGPRPVLKGRSSSGMVNPYKGTAGKYSFYPLFADSRVLDGAPDNNHVPGTGSHPGNVLLSQIFNGTSLYVHPLSGTFKNGAAYEGARFRPHTYRGALGVFTSGYGHVDRSTNYSLYSNYVFDGVTSANVFASGYGHVERETSYSLYGNDMFDGVPSAEIFKSGYGQPNTTSEYGRNKVGEYKGVPSAKAL